MTKEEKALYDKAYREKHKEHIAERLKRYAILHKQHLKLYKHNYYIAHKAKLNKQSKDYREKHITAERKYKKTQHTLLRQQIIELYSHGTCKCMHCGGAVEELHHTNPADGTWEKEHFCNETNAAARLHQLEMYTVIPDYITPLCKKCHKKIHKESNQKEIE